MACRSGLGNCACYGTVPDDRRDPTWNGRDSYIAKMSIRHSFWGFPPYDGSSEDIHYLREQWTSLDPTDDGCIDMDLTSNRYTGRLAGTAAGVPGIESRLISGPLTDVKSNTATVRKLDGSPCMDLLLSRMFTRAEFESDLRALMTQFRFSRFQAVVPKYRDDGVAIAPTRDFSFIENHSYAWYFDWDAGPYIRSPLGISHGAGNPPVANRTIWQQQLQRKVGGTTAVYTWDIEPGTPPIVGEIPRVISPTPSEAIITGDLVTVVLGEPSIAIMRSPLLPGEILPPPILGPEFVF